LVHRDLHSDNVLVEKAPDGSPSDAPTSVRIIDFGAAGLYGESMKPRLMSREAGWLQYFSPERRLGQPFDDRDDVWAAGCHLTELSSGTRVMQRNDCGPGGVDFSTSPAAVRLATSACTDSRCRQLSEYVLTFNRDLRPRATDAKELTRRLLGYNPRKRRRSAGNAKNSTNRTVAPPRRRSQGGGGGGGDAASTRRCRLQHAQNVALWEAWKGLVQP